ncbi:flagellar protein MotY [Pseudomonas chlororaphis]|uniref:OmpA family outer membrane protein n=1 Tax=Pseudomonas chlororaphis TaxID=587753 RepID=A0AAX3FV43_9PSED|nr:OmpA family protein [Pseudomonas chlororaphis]AVO60905.1 OmpA family protein [Pseudomonas chlororaphis subsp. piscium]AZC39592.1 Sodium-type flagellar protein motY precursor [Pseudomonas chlororaphis subsp. piscium]AZC46143.1 Sodium-type flagellar protein motY precursor [Pseudomonas chlororaphis subsp. piscium]AZC52894.1 Sodium-type flagellar protein motY precursor [Pseudomonas chlororaphis subsp. piscium]AZC59151.1 Sodium-type flagellar protein motY precursor [Pseudomonas chlororaphis subs
MRQRYLALLSVFASLPAMALTFQTRLESIEWTVEGDKFECRLSQPITDFGSGEFVRRAGEQATFRLKAYNPMLGGGSATLLAAAAPWQPGRGDINLGSVRLGSGDVLFNSSQLQAGRLIGGLMEGRSPVVRHYSREGGVSEVRLLPVRFSKAYGDYQSCVAKLLPKNFDQVRQSEVGFPGGGIDLDAKAKARLQVMLEFLKADPTVNHIQLDGHSDNSGNRLTNRDLSRRRALAVMEFFKANGIPESQIEMRFHGERYPLAPNTNAANRAKNRRVNVQLQRVPVAEKPAPQAAAPANAAATS